MKQIRLLSAVLLLVCFALGITGCSKKDLAAMAVGKWTGKVKGADVNFEFKADKTFNANSAGAPVEGTWAVEGDKLKLTLTKVMGMDLAAIEKIAAASPGAAKSSNLDDLNKPLVGAFSEDGKTLNVNQPGAKDDEPLTLAKQA